MQPCEKVKKSHYKTILLYKVFKMLNSSCNATLVILIFSSSSMFGRKNRDNFCGLDGTAPKVITTFSSVFQTFETIWFGDK